MRASEFVAKLQALIAEHGDLEVTDSHDNPVADPEFASAAEEPEGSPPVFVVEAYQ